MSPSSLQAALARIERHQTRLAAGRRLDQVIARQRREIAAEATIPKG